MRMAVILALAGCASVTPPQPPVTPGVSCAEACAHEARLGCLEVTVDQCTDGCEFYEADGVDQGNTCVLRADSCEEIDRGC